MRLVVDANVLIRALLSAPSLPAQTVLPWRVGRFDLLTTAARLDGLMRVTRTPKIRGRLAPALAGRLVNDLRAFALTLDRLPVPDHITALDTAPNLICKECLNLRTTFYMGDGRERRKNNASILLANPICCYCGEKASTVDHCPARCFFIRRQWPEGYAFPCCESCNALTRYDEQLLAVLTRISIREDRNASEEAEWKKLFRGVRNNQPEVLEEWGNMSATCLKRFYRESFGNRGDVLRHFGFRALNIGPITISSLNRFIVKLAKALYYKHVGYRCNGTITWTMVDTITDNSKEDYINNILIMVPSLADVQCNSVDLSDQFCYRFNASAEYGALIALVRFSEQFLFHLVVLSRETAENINIRPDEKFTVSAI